MLQLQEQLQWITFETTGGVNIPVNWPGGGGVVPVMTNAVNAIDVYSYIYTFDGGTSLYGIVGGQNFS